MLLLTIALQAGIVAASPASSTDIVVTATRLREALEQCQQGGCSVRRDAQVSIAAAEQLFRAGDYGKARSILFASIARNRDHAAEEPRPVAALYEAYATVSIHFGDPAAYRRGVSRQVRTLRDHLPQDDPSVLAADFVAADQWIQARKFHQADQTLDAAARRSEAIGKTRWSAIATLHRAALAASLGSERRAEEFLKAARAKGADDAVVSRLARIVELRIAADKGDDARIDSLVRTVGNDPRNKRSLVWAPPYPLDPAAAANTPDAFQQQSSARVEQSSQLSVAWVDVGFWIAPDGRTRQVEVLRGSRSQKWVSAMLTQVAARRYAASADGVELPGDYRIERFSWRAPLGYVTGSNARQRVSAPELQVLDLTDPSATVTVTR